MVPTLVSEMREKIEKALPSNRVVPAHTEMEHYYKDTVDGEVYPSVTTKTSLLSRSYYKQMAANKAVERIQSYLLSGGEFDPDTFAEVCDEARYAHVADLDQAGKWGTESHDIIDNYVAEWINSDVRPESIRYFIPRNTTPFGICGALSAEKFFNDYTLFPVASEKKIISKKHKYGGTLDSLWYVGEPTKEGDMSCKHSWFEKGKNFVKCGVCGRQEKLTLLLGDWKTSNQIFGYGAMGKYEYAMQVGGYDQALREMAKIRPKKHWIVRLDKHEPKYEIGYVTDIKRATRMFLHMNEVSDFARSNVPPVDKLHKKKQITL